MEKPLKWQPYHIALIYGIISKHIYRLLSFSSSMENATKNIILLFAGMVVVIAGYSQLPGIPGYVGLGAGVAMIILGILGYKNKKVY